MKQSSRSVLAACCCILVVLEVVLPATRAAAVLHKRAVADQGTRNGGGVEPLVKTCHVSTPCGWAVYTPHTRRVDYFIRNTCQCPRDKKCLRTDDDLSVSAYVYRCREHASSTPSPDQS